jgi:hypothetical protein
MHKTIFLGASALMAVCVVGASRADDFTGEKPAVQTADRLEWAWDGGDRLAVAVPGTVHYQASGSPRVIVRGPADLLSRVRYDHGELRMENDFFRSFSDEKLDVTVSGTPLRRVGVAGSADVELGELHQDRLVLSIAGSGKLAASGQADDLSLHIAGSGHGDLAKLSSKNFAAHIAGSGKVDAGGAEQGSVSIAGSGEVQFATAMPKDMNVHVTGSGIVRDANGQVIGRNEARLHRDERTR